MKTSASNRRLAILLSLWFIYAPPSRAGQGTQAAIATAHPLATEAGAKVLAAGGNAFDAAVAVSAALAVVEPYASGLGGGGFWLLHRARDGKQVVLDGRETAPRGAARDMYVRPVPGASINAALLAAVPGLPAGLAHLAAHYGRWPLKRSLAPAIRLARGGFLVTPRYREMAKLRLDALRTSPAAAAVFLSGREAPSVGHRIVQPDLARLLADLGERGATAFYTGEFASHLVRGVRAAGGIWSRDDLAGYRAVEREPIRVDYHGIRIVTAPPPSSGGIVLAEALNILEGYDLDRFDGPTRKHVIVEALRRAYQDRAEHLGDPDFVSVPIQQLLSDRYARLRRRGIDLERATPSHRLPQISVSGSGNTTHFSIIDCEGNRVAATLSINNWFGSGYMVPGTGVLLNDEMDDFSVSPGVPNTYGLVGGEANAIAPRKRPLSSMTPTFLEDRDRLAIVGTPGGSRIISTVLLAVLDFTAGRPIATWVARPRFHHQYLPDRIEYEPFALTPNEQAGLRRRDHALTRVTRRYGNMQAIFVDAAAVHAASDPRGEGTARVLGQSLCTLAKASNLR
ncbi:MAG: gamma-glutamyltransferase [Gammaproteobacteria bacterium]